MRKLIVFMIAIVSLFAFCNAFAESIYTWKDKNGVLNITDYAPPAGAEILDISPSYREETEELLRKRRNRQMELEQAEIQRLQEQRAAEARRREAAKQRQLEQLRLQQESQREVKSEKSKGY